MSHLTPAQLTAYRDGERDDPEVALHLAECGACRARLAEGERLASLLQHADPESMREHPSDVLLAAYLEDTLSGSERRRVTDHLLSCTRCSTLLETVRSALTEIE